ncbi:hypothetical protein CsSME_00041595 [Camellia sinensis var. sinensis]
MSSPTVFSTILFVALAMVVLSANTPQAEAARAFFVFGDSLVDNGNNNYLLTTARADSPPYGIDYPTHRPTGRFSNGLNIPDIISEQLGSESTLPYLNPELDGQKLLVGANFASAGIGILFNPELIQMIQSLNQELGSDVFIAVNAMQMSTDFISNPQAFGFVTSKVACCGQGPYNGLGVCTPASNLCPDRNVYAFWDPFHPTEKANRIIVQQMMTGSNRYMNPMNLSTIMAMDSMN